MGEIADKDAERIQTSCYLCGEWGGSALKLHGSIRLCHKFKRLTTSEENCNILINKECEEEQIA